MKVQYQISENDFVNSMRLLWKRSLTEKIVLGTMVGGLAALGVYNLTSDLYSLSSWLFIALAIYFISSPTIALWSARMTYKTYKDIIGEPRAVELVDDGVIFTTDDTRILLRWNKIRHWQQNDEFILICVMPQVIHVIPKSLRDQGFDIDQLVKVLTEKFED